MVALKEAVRPVCSPAYAAEHAETLAGPFAGWIGLTLLDLLRPNKGWATWEDWFALAGHPPGTARRLGLDSYTYVLEAAAGTGLALGWRHYIERFLEAGTLVALGDGFVEFDRVYYGVLTGKGRRKPLARPVPRLLQRHGLKLDRFAVQVDAEGAGRYRASRLVVGPPQLPVRAGAGLLPGGTTDAERPTRQTREGRHIPLCRYVWRGWGKSASATGLGDRKRCGRQGVGGRS